MPGLSSPDRRWLEEKFGPRANFDPTERLLYGHDIAAMPGLVKPLISGTLPEAVVQPANEAEVAELVAWAAKRGIPLVPRGKATSGYGGVIPTRNGLVVDFFRLAKVLAVDAAAETVTVEPGITWEKLDKALAAKGLTLRLYPTSYPSSSVGGWLAQGGAGIGSYEYGWFAENVVSARVVAPEGGVRVVAGPDLDLVADAEGITGLITSVTLKVRRAEDLAVAAFASPGANALSKAFQALIGEKLPVWSAIFINPRMAEMKNQSPGRTHLGHEAEPKVRGSAGWPRRAWAKS
jgi:FAD/FMN-containing dehydrogenase